MSTDGPLCVTKLPLTKHITVQQFGAILSTTVKEPGRAVTMRFAIPLHSLSYLFLCVLYSSVDQMCLRIRPTVTYPYIGFAIEMVKNTFANSMFSIFRAVDWYGV
jgi:hypothetical protein